MNKPIKRLEIIKYAIELEDDGIILSQLPLLKNEVTDPELAFIVHALEEKNYSEAMRAITVWLQNQRSVVSWQDPQVAASKLELKALEEQMRELIDKRNARIQLLDEFNDLYLTRLGPLMSQILRLRKTLAEAAVRRQEAEARRREADYLRCQKYLSQAVEVLVTLTKRWQSMPPHSLQAAEARKHLQQQSELIASLLAEAQELERGLTREEEPTRQARDEARQEYESYQEQQHDAEKRFSFEQKMSEDERHELKRLWRQASKLCHPDLVDNELKNDAHSMMVQLNQARQRGDLSTIRSILTRLQKGLEPLMASDRLNDLQRLRQRILEVKQHIASLIEELATLEKEESWQLISTLGDRETYFRQQEKALAEIRQTLEQQVSEAEYDEVA
ncbi:coiled-coil domain-containing protein [Kosakonia pseudosacchari]|uniref:DNA repair protein n=1 Tax=Kosakonia pseudosacchari TaxID=1646340 RepID=A0ABX4IP13_9ENTR|nr:DNA repair protein [Kosakonia pseudosacchari]PDO86186.1 DNA repair protein [Kosakonia pseudosacchari]QOV63518.1 DNA repair protein [Kosakonia pseudosacchari]WBU49939.1 DNA repair protein [Kosakonia pseudosacchari]